MKAALMLVALLCLCSVADAGLAMHPDGCPYWVYEVELLENGTLLMVVDASLVDFLDEPEGVIWELKPW